jgi:hypothetical protein
MSDPDKWRFPVCDEPEAFAEEPDRPDAWVWSCDEPDETLNPAAAVLDPEL